MSISSDPKPKPASQPPPLGTGNTKPQDVPDEEVLAEEDEQLYQAVNATDDDGGQHPSELVTTTTLAFATPQPDLTLLHEDLRSNTALSSAQRSAVCFARARQLEGGALLIADGTGVGKGRELAATLLNHLKHEKDAARFIFITVSSSLEADFRRDLLAVGWPLDRLPLRQLTGPPSDRVKLNRGVLFLTYGLLRTRQKSGRSRLEQVVAWGKAAKGTVSIAFDEVHAAKGKTATRDVVVQLQTRLPSAAVVYASATAASTPEHLTCLPRLRLWGDEGCPFLTMDSFLKNIGSSKSAATMELVATELASRGAFVSRRLSYAGTSFELLAVSLDREQRQLHGRLCSWFERLFETTIFDSKTGKSIYWGSHLRFFKALLVGFRVRAVAERASAHIASGGQVVVSLTSTGEAAAGRVTDDDELDEGGFVALKSTLKDLVERARKTDGSVVTIDRGTSVQVVGLVERTDLNGRTATVCGGADELSGRYPARLADGSEVALSLQNMKRIPCTTLDELEEQIETFSLPPSPLDALLDALNSIGAGVVELTGRSHSWERKDSAWVKVKRGISNTALCGQFQRGEVRCAVISAAASTGISLHDTKDNAVSRPRLQIMVELAYAADA